MEDLNIVVRERLEKAAEFERQDVALYPNGYAVAHKIKDLQEGSASKTAEELEADNTAYTIAGRVLSVRSFGKSAFMHIADRMQGFRYIFSRTRSEKRSTRLRKSWTLAI